LISAAKYVSESYTGAYKSVLDTPLPDENSPDYTAALLYKARSHIALNDPQSALKIIPAGSENVALKAVASLARYIAGKDDTSKEAALEELRDLSVEIEDEVEGTEREKALVRVLAGTAFARAGELEEALETFGTETEDLEAYVSTSWRRTTLMANFLSTTVLLSSFNSTSRSTGQISPRSSLNALSDGQMTICCCS
jgi:hypothetical protein